MPSHFPQMSKKAGTSLNTIVTWSNTCGQFHKTFFIIIYAAIGVLPYVLTEVTLLGE
jgi:hypothetical protein